MSGVRPNSPMTRTTVVSSRPRDSRSASNTDSVWSRRGAKVRAKCLLVLAVRVPLAVPVAGGAHEAAARLDQASCQQHTLPHPVARRRRPEAMSGSWERSKALSTSGEQEHPQRLS